MSIIDFLLIFEMGTATLLFLVLWGWLMSLQDKVELLIKAKQVERDRFMELVEESRESSERCDKLEAAFEKLVDGLGTILGIPIERKK
jgi:hypothetical protein